LTRGAWETDRDVNIYFGIQYLAPFL